jgi:hypothetical protein
MAKIRNSTPKVDLSDKVIVSYMIRIIEFYFKSCRIYSNIGKVRPGPAASLTPRPVLWFVNSCTLLLFDIQWIQVALSAMPGKYWRISEEIVAILVRAL